MNRSELLEIAKPILFNTEMVKAILEYRKTVTRRIIKYPACGYFEHEPPRIIPKYQVGDILYVRETWLKADDGIHYRADETSASKEIRKSYGYKWKPSIHMPKKAARIFLKVTDVRVEKLQDITILQAISEGAMYDPPAFPRAIMRDCYNQKLPYAVASFAVIWDRTIKKQDLNKYSWEANPFVWVIEFERINN